MYADGHGLYLHVGAGNSKSWIFRYKIDGRRRDMGLGPIELVPLAEARDLALDLRRIVRKGTDPLEAKRQEKANRRFEQANTISLADAAARYIAAHEKGWKDKRGWPDSMRLYINPIIGDLPVAAVDLPAVMRVLEPIWHTKTTAAQNVRGRMEAVLNWATTNGYRSGENPARWRGHLENLLPRPSKIARVEHHKALPYREVAEFMAKLRSHEGIAAAALEFAILTCARAGEVLGARWNEIDSRELVWTVPGERMKSGREHKVPLSAPALAVLDRMTPFKRNGDNHIFLGQRVGRPMASPRLLDCLKWARPGVTVHGFRSSFRDWAAEQTTFPGEIAELALAHTVGSKVEAAYRRGTMFEKRRQIMDAWARYCARPDAKSEVVKLRSA